MSFSQVAPRPDLVRQQELQHRHTKGMLLLEIAAAASLLLAGMGSVAYMLYQGIGLLLW